MNLIPGFTDIRPVQALGPVYALFFGPLGCLASACGNLVGDVIDDALRWTSIAGFATNFLGPFLVWHYWARVSRTPFSLRTPRDLLRHTLVLVASSLLQTAILAPSVALVYPEVDIALFAWSVLGDTTVFPIVFGIPLSILMQEEFGFVPVGGAAKAPSAPFAALAFKIMTDPFVGKLCFFRVYSGSIQAGESALNVEKKTKERFGRILQMHANDRKDIDACYAGDIAAIVGTKNTTTGDTLCDEKHPILLESMEFPEPVIKVAIEPKTKAGQEKMSIALAKLAEEDPTFKTYTDEETGQTIIAGMGELHLEIIVDRLLREFKVEANVGKPQVSYKETITKAADEDCKYARQSGGKGQYGHVKITIEPNEPGKGYEFINKVVGGEVPKEYIPAVDAGIQGAMQAGVLAGYNVVDVKVTLTGGSYHEVDSSEMAFKIAGSMAFKNAMRKAAPVLTEPIMKVVVITPDDYLGDVIGDLNSRRGNISSMEPTNGATQITASVPLSNMFGYATDLRSRTQGRGIYSMEPSHFSEVPKSIADGIISGRRVSN